MSVELTVLLPFYNAEATIEEALAGLAAQRWVGEWEVVAVDNRSTDRSRSIVESYIGRLPRLRVVNALARQGQPHALNVGWRAALGA